MSQKKTLTKSQPKEFAKTGNELRRLRLRAGLSQAELAKQIGDVHSQFVSNWERGICAPPRHCHAQLTKVLGFNKNIRAEVFEAVMDDAGKRIARQFGLLIR